ncbi:MAG: AraC family transcriptional regulator [Bacteroidetes bacterium]|nr:AraC family transcriptional regulator [Bacteroidota bacterium]
MPARKLLNTIPLTQPTRLQTLTENRRFFNLKHCELNVFESYEQSYNVPLRFGDFVITSMVRGKKIMHLFDEPAFDYLPGESVIVPANETMFIDFPEAVAGNPTQCIALAVDKSYIIDTVDYLNEYYNSAKDAKENWTLHFSQYHFHNDTDVTDLINKLIRVCSSEDNTKNIYADLSLKELLIRLLQSQRLQLASHSGSGNSSRMSFILEYIQEHLTEKIAVDQLSRKVYLSRNIFYKWFKEQFGLTPLEYIMNERIKLARQLLTDEKKSVSQISLLCGFNDVNYFVRAFRKSEGLTPGAFRLACRS